MKTRKQKKPSYVNVRSSFAGIEERLALASLAFSKTWTVSAANYRREIGAFGHSVRFFSKKEGWESRFTWYDEDPRINLTAVKRFIAEGIEGARLRWWEAQQPLKGELLEIITKLNSGKAA